MRLQLLIPFSQKAEKERKKGGQVSMFRGGAWLQWVLGERGH